MIHKTLASLLLCVAATAQAAPLYTLAKTVPIGAPDRWDLLTYDTASHRVYIAHGDRVTVVDVPSGKVVGNVEGYAGGTHGVAIVPALHRGYTDDSTAGTANSFDVNSLKALKSIPAADDADAIAFDKATGHLFVIDSDPGKITVIDPKMDRVIATLDGGGKLEIAAADGLGNVFVNGEAKREILRINARTNIIDARWPIPDCESPHGIAVDPRGHHVFSSCANKLMVVLSTQDGSILASLPIGARTDGAAFDPGSRRAFSSNGDGTLTVIGESSTGQFTVLDTVPTAIGARTMTIDPKSGELFLIAGDVTENAAADPKDFRHRYPVTPGTAKLLIFDRAN
jgi:DNA-binding beta-propeller fold protein YncE